MRTHEASRAPPAETPEPRETPGAWFVSLPISLFWRSISTRRCGTSSLPADHLEWSRSGVREGTSKSTVVPLPEEKTCIFPPMS